MERKQPSYRMRFIILIAVFFVVFFSSFLMGHYAVPLGTVLKILGSRIFPVEQTWDAFSEAVVLNVRLPRIIAAALIGAALSGAGAAYQGMFRNPMVSPDLLGASKGAGFGASLAILMGFSYAGITVTAFCIGLAAVILAYLVGRASRLNSTLALVLAGIMISSLFDGGTSFVKLVADTDEQLPAITYWLMGSLTSVRGPDAAFVAVPIIVGLVPLLLLRWRINLLTVSEDEARSLGIHTGRLRAVVIVCATMMTAASVAVSGMISWVGLIIPHLCRMLFGQDYRRILPASVLLGASFLMLVDNVARNLITSEIPIGILTSFIGAPLFIYLILTGGAGRES